MGNALPIRSIKSSERLFGMTAAWPVLMQDCARRSTRIPELRDEFWHNLRVVGTGEELNQSLEKANRISDFLELAELMCTDALDRTESCGGHFRVESQTPEGEAKRDDANFAYTAAWEWKGAGQAPRPSQGTAQLRVRSRFRKGVTSSHESHAQSLAAAKRKRTGRASSAIA